MRSVGITLFESGVPRAESATEEWASVRWGIVLHRRIGRSIRRAGFRSPPTTSSVSFVSKPCPEMRPVLTRVGFTERTRTP